MGVAVRGWLEWEGHMTPSTAEEASSPDKGLDTEKTLEMDGVGGASARKGQAVTPTQLY